MPNNDDTTGDDRDWKQAIDICKNIEELDHDEALSYVSSLTLSNNVRTKISNILSRMNEEQSILDSNDFNSIIDKTNEISTNIIGKTIDSYKIIKLLAKGGMSSVFLAESIQVGIKKPVALKVLSPYIFTGKSVELFKREQLILSKLEHPNIVSFHHSGKTDDGTNYLVMEYIDSAQTIVDYSETNNLNTKQIVKLILKLARVFAYSHSNLVIHRDIKPSNLLVDKQDNIKVIDFGIGQLTYKSGNTSTQVFTLDSASPEQILGKNVNIQTDVFSLGAVLLQLLTKKSPLPKTNIASYSPQDDVNYINKLLKESRLDKDLKNIVFSAMHIDLSKRYASMEIFASDLDKYLQSKPISASADSWNYRLSKFYQRNRVLSILTVTLSITIIASSFLVHNLAIKNQIQQSKKESSFALIDALFVQANPIINKGFEDSGLMVGFFEKMAAQQEKLLQSDPELANFFYKKLGHLYDSKGFYIEALTAYQRSMKALKLYGKLGSDEYLTRRITIYHLTGSVDDLQKSKKQAYQFLSDLESLTNVNPKHRLNAYYLLSKVHSYLNETEKAAEIGKKAQDWIDIHPDIAPLLLASMYNSMAVVNIGFNKAELAENQYLQAIEILKAEKDQPVMLASALTNFATLKGKAGDYEASQKYFDEAIGLLKEVDEKHPNLTRIYMPYSTLLRITGRIDESKSILLEAIEILNHIQQQKRISAMVHAKLARINLIQNDTNIAIANIMESFNLAYKRDNPDVFELYVLALWALQSTEDPSYAKNIIEFMMQSNMPEKMNPKLHADFLVQKALIYKEAYFGSSVESIVTEYLYSATITAVKVKIKWLQNQLAELDKLDSIFAVWIKSQLHTLKSFDDFKSYCNLDAIWSKSQKIFMKKMILTACFSLDHEIIENFDLEFKAYQQKLHKPVVESTQIREQLVNLLTSG